jgi:aldehyde:ferredoxin oxidoreductase
MAIPGYHNRVLEVDLSTGSIKIEPLQPQDALLYLGGRGLATKLLYERIDPKTDPLGPGNIVMIATLPLIGSQAPTAARGHMVYKSSISG